jgi:hypothetical protein
VATVEGIRIYGEDDPSCISDMLLANSIAVTMIDFHQIGLEGYYLDIMREANRNEQ